MYLPASHAVQLAPSGVYPALQVQLRASELPAVDDDFGVHWSHAEDPGHWAYVPLGHRVHRRRPLALEYDPGAHTVQLLKLLP